MGLRWLKLPVVQRVEAIFDRLTLYHNYSICVESQMQTQDVVVSFGLLLDFVYGRKQQASASNGAMLREESTEILLLAV